LFPSDNSPLGNKRPGTTLLRWFSRVGVAYRPPRRTYFSCVWRQQLARFVRRVSFTCSTLLMCSVFASS